MKGSFEVVWGIGLGLLGCVVLHFLHTPVGFY